MEHQRNDEDLDSSTRLIKNAAEKRGVTFEGIVYYKDEVEHEIYELSYGGKSHILDITSPDTTSSIGNRIADNKYLTHKMLEKLNVPCANYAMYTDIKEAIDYFDTLNYSCVVKPIHGGGGDGVSIDINSRDEFIECFKYTQSFCEYVLIEEFYHGIDTRFLVVDGKVIAISRREPGFVIGDGKSSIATLIHQTNLSRSEGRKGHLSKLRIDKIALNYLNKQGLSLQSQPKKEKKVYVRPNANLNTGGTSFQVDKSTVSTEICRLIEKVAVTFGLSVAGIDVISVDISKPLQSNNGIVLEINDRPRIRMHEMPFKGDPIAVSDKIIDMLFK